MALADGTRLGPYEIVGLLSKGTKASDPSERSNREFHGRQTALQDKSNVRRAGNAVLWLRGRSVAGPWLPQFHA